MPQYDPQALLREALPGDAGHAALGNGAIAFGSGVVVGRWLIDSWGWQPWDMRWRGHGQRPGSHYDRPPRPPLPPYPGPDQPRPPAPIALNVKPPTPAPVPPGTSVQVPPPQGQRPPPNFNVNAHPPMRSNDRPMYRLPGEEVPSAPAGMPLGTQPTQFGQPGQASQPGHAHGSTGMVGNGNGNDNDNGAAGHSQTPKPPHLQPGGDPILRPNGAVPVQPPHPAQPPQAIPAPAAGHPSGRSDAGNWRMAPPGTQQAANRPDLSPPMQTKPAPIDSRGELAGGETLRDVRTRLHRAGH